MKMLLYSSYKISEVHRAALANLIGKPLESVNVAAVTNAADTEYDSQDWMKANVDALGCREEIVDLRSRATSDELRSKLSGKEMVWALPTLLCFHISIWRCLPRG